MIQKKMDSPATLVLCRKGLDVLPASAISKLVEEGFLFKPENVRISCYKCITYMACKFSHI